MRKRLLSGLMSMLVLGLLLGGVSEVGAAPKKAVVTNKKTETKKSTGKKKSTVGSKTGDKKSTGGKSTGNNKSVVDKKKDTDYSGGLKVTVKPGYEGVKESTSSVTFSPYEGEHTKANGTQVSETKTGKTFSGELSGDAGATKGAATNGVIGVNNKGGSKKNTKLGEQLGLVSSTSKKNGSKGGVFGGVVDECEDMVKVIGVDGTRDYGVVSVGVWGDGDLYKSKLRGTWKAFIEKALKKGKVDEKGVRYLDYGEGTVDIDTSGGGVVIGGVNKEIVGSVLVNSETKRGVKVNVGGYLNVKSGKESMLPIDLVNKAIAQGGVIVDELSAVREGEGVYSVEENGVEKIVQGGYYVVVGGEGEEVGVLVTGVKGYVYDGDLGGYVDDGYSLEYTIVVDKRE